MSDPNPISEPGPSTVLVQRYASLESGSITVNANGDPATSTINVNYINETTFDQGVTIEGVNINNGLIGGASPDVTEIILLPDFAVDSSGIGGAVNRLAGSKGSANQRVSAVLFGSKGSANQRVSAVLFGSKGSANQRVSAVLFG